MKKRLAAGFLSICLLVSQGVIPISAYAEGTETGGLCEHHPVHTVECGYAEGTPCNHAHTDDCYRLVEKCVHNHTADCYPEDNTDDTATPSDAEPIECGHVCSEETGCIRKVLNCQHVHDSECGFAEGHACGYVCEICGASTDKDSGKTEPSKETCSCTERCSAEQVNKDCPVCKEDYSDCTAEQKPDIAGGIITEFSRLDKEILNQQVDSGTALEDLNLPDELEVSVYAEDEAGESDTVTVTTVAVTGWDSAPAYEGEIGTYEFTPELAGAYPVKEGVKAPKITVTVVPAQANGLTVNITGWKWIDPDKHLSEGILALPGVNTDHQASFDEVVSMLPKQISAVIEGVEKPEAIDITGWKCPEYKQDKEENWPTSGSYRFISILPEGYSLAEEAAPLEIEVLIGAANVLQTEVTGDFTVTGDSAGYEYSADSRTLTVKGGADLTISGNTGQDKIVVESGATAAIILDGLSINVGGASNVCAFDMTGATVTPTLKEGRNNYLQSGTNRAGIEAPGGATLTINGSGRLTALGGLYGAGIGGGSGSSGGNITIKDGTITATSNYGGRMDAGGAGIGGGYRGNGGHIIISGGTITATGGGLGNNGKPGAGIGGGGEGGSGGIIEISGGVITAHGETGIGGGYSYGNGGTITISGGNITASGVGGAGIGGGYRGSGGTITISGGTIKATSGYDAAGIGGGKWAAGGSLSINGNNAVIFTTSISDKSGERSWSGVVIEGNSGKVYGSNITPEEDLTIPNGTTLVIQSGTTLTIKSGRTLTNYGTITVESGGTLNTEQCFVFNNFGTLNGDGTKPDEGSYNNKKSILTLEASNAAPVYDDTITLTATVSEKTTTNSLLRSTMPLRTVFFYCDNKEIGREEVDPDTKTATISVHLEKPTWTAGSHSITAKYTGSNDQLLPAESSITLNVGKADQTPESVTVSSTTATYGGAAPTFTPVSVKDNAYVYYEAVNSPGENYSNVAYIDGTTIYLQKAGTFYVAANIIGTKNYNYKTIYSDKITVNKGDSQFTATVKKDTVVTNSFTYGDTITVDVSGIQARAANSRSAISQNNVYLFAADPDGSPDTENAIASKTAWEWDDNATLTYDTTEKKIAIGNNQTLWIAYGGSSGLNPVTQTVTVNLAVKPLTATVDSSDSSAIKPYDGNADFSNVKLELIGIESGDTVTATASGTTSDSDPGNNKAFAATTVTLDGAHKDWYSLEASGVSGNVNITKAAGKLVISCGNVTYGTAVSPSVTTNTSNGTVTYSYEGRDDTSYGPSATAPTDAGTYKVTGTAEATKNYEKAISATVDFEIFKAAGESIPQVTGSYTGDGFTFTYTINLIPGAEYSKDNSAWQDSNSFTGFRVGESVTFYARMKKDQNHTAGASNNTGAVTFTRLVKEENPALAYTITGATGNKKITITQVTGCEYTFDGGSSWDSSNEHTFDTDGKPTIGIRYAQTATHKASAGATQEVDLTNREQDAPEAFTLTFTDNGDGTFTATIPQVEGGEYSFDGANWSGVNTKKDCKPNMSYTGYVRLAVKDGYNASSATSDTKTAPRLIVAAPVIAPNGGSFIGSQNVTITTATSGASIYYTTDGTLPTSASTAYKGQFTLTGSATVQTIAVKDGYEDSPVTKATFTRTHSGGSGGGSSSDSSGNSGSSSGQTDVSAPSKPDAPTIGTITPGTPDKNGSVSIPSEQVENAINNALKDAEKNRQTKNGVAIAVNLPTGASSATLDRASLKKLIDSSVKSFKLNFDGVALSFDLAALKEIAGKTTGTLTFGANKATGLAGDALTAIGSRPAYNLTVSWLVNGKAAYISNFGAGSVSVAMNYTPAEKELTGSLYAVYVDGGKVEWIDKSSYDRNSKAVIFQTNHFSSYGIGYKAPPAFTDTANHWAKADIDFVVSRGLFSGTSSTTFSPNDIITRGMFVTALGKLAGINPKAYPSSRFTDVPATAYYAPYVEWAAGKGIVNGTGEKNFSPDAAVTREQMAVFMQRYANSLTYTLPITREAESFADESQITGDMKDAVRAMQQAGIMNGKDGHRFGPKDTATRAEAAAVLRRFVTIVIDPAAAGGWAQNDTGHWLYYVDGKPVTGWKQIESKWYYFDTTGIMQTGGWKQIGGKWYYFYADGVMAVSTKIDDYEVGPDGARKDK